MLGVLGVSPRVDLKVREKLVILEKHVENKLLDIKKICNENVILSTCNRTEIYFISEDEKVKDEIIKILGWDDYKDYLFFLKDEQVVYHLMEVACGFDSLILGEEQILGQVKNSLMLARKAACAATFLDMLFQTAIACGKQFRFLSELYKIPISVASIVSNEVEKRNKKRILILGYGEIGRLCAKYLSSKNIVEKIYIAVRELEKAENFSDKATFIEFSEWRKYIEKVECLISCTSAPHTVVKRSDVEKKDLLIFDLAVPRDVEEDVKDIPSLELYDIDEISRMNERNLIARKELMEKNKGMLNEYAREYLEWYRLRKIVPVIENIKSFSEGVYKARFKRLKNKYADLDLELAEVLFKSTADVFAERAIKVLKEEYLNGRGEECLRIISKIFAE